MIKREYKKMSNIHDVDFDHEEMAANGTKIYYTRF